MAIIQDIIAVYPERVGPFLPRRSLPVKWFAYLSASWFWPPEFKLGHWLWLCDLRIPYYTSISSTVPLYTHPLNCKFYIESVLLLMSLHLLSRIIFITLSVSLSPTPAPPTEQLEVGRGRLSLSISLNGTFLTELSRNFFAQPCTFLRATIEFLTKVLWYALVCWMPETNFDLSFSKWKVAKNEIQGATG